MGPGIRGKITDYKLPNRWTALVPTEFERREAARFAGYTWSEFQSLPGTRAVMEQLEVSDCKTAVIAHYRNERLYEAVMIDLRDKHPPPKKPKQR